MATRRAPTRSSTKCPLTYRSAPLAGADRALVGTIEHSVLGTRWVYDAPHDPAYVAELLRTIVDRRPRSRPFGRPRERDRAR
ncbi:MAG: hypothetical protein V9F04_06650 [Dermatophilaceae bacterium]